MLNQNIVRFLKKGFDANFKEEDWQKLHSIFKKIPEKNKIKLIEKLSAYTGVSITDINKLFSKPLGSTRLLRSLVQQMKTNTLNINQFMKRSFFQNFPANKIPLSRTEVNKLIMTIESKKVHRLTPLFFLLYLSEAKHLSWDKLIDKFRTKQPPRQIKKPYIQPITPPRKMHHWGLSNSQHNPLVIDINSTPERLQEALKNKGVRVTNLIKKEYIPTETAPSTPTRPTRPRNTVNTPNGTELTLFSKIGKHSVFKISSPSRKLANISENKMKQLYPKADLRQAGAVEFCVMLENIKERQGVPRRQKALAKMGASAKQLFKSYYLDQIESSEHWAHLIAHSFTDEQNIRFFSTKINLVPTTAASNYTTLNLVENFVRNTLIEGKTDRILMKVTPQYTDESAIPYQLIYKLNWERKKEDHIKSYSEVFYISAKTYTNPSRAMIQTIDTIRKYLDEDEDEDLFDDPLPKLDFSKI